MSTLHKCPIVSGINPGMTLVNLHAQGKVSALTFRKGKTPVNREHADRIRDAIVAEAPPVLWGEIIAWWDAEEGLLHIADGMHRTDALSGAARITELDADGDGIKTVKVKAVSVPAVRVRLLKSKAEAEFIAATANIGAESWRPFTASEKREAFLAAFRANPERYKAAHGPKAIEAHAKRCAEADKAGEKRPAALAPTWQSVFGYSRAMTFKLIGEAKESADKAEKRKALKEAREAKKQAERLLKSARQAVGDDDSDPIIEQAQKRFKESDKVERELHSEVDPKGYEKRVKAETSPSGKPKGTTAPPVADEKEAATAKAFSGDPAKAAGELVSGLTVGCDTVSQTVDALKWLDGYIGELATQAAILRDTLPEAAANLGQ